MTNDALLSVHQDDLFTLSQSSGLDAVRLAGIDADGEGTPRAGIQEADNRAQ